MSDEEFQKLCDRFQSLGGNDYAPVVPPLIPPAIEAIDAHSAKYAHEVIMERIKEFEDALDNEHEVALKLASFGQSITLAITDIIYSNPSTLIFYGLVGGQQAALIQDKSQLNFLLVAVPKHDPEKPPRRIGFTGDLEQTESANY